MTTSQGNDNKSADPINSPVWKERLDRLFPCGKVGSSGKHTWEPIGSLVGEDHGWVCKQCFQVWAPSQEDIAQYERLAAQGATLAEGGKPL